MQNILLLYCLQKWRISKGILTSPNLLWQEISRVQKLVALEVNHWRQDSQPSKYSMSILFP